MVKLRFFILLVGVFAAGACTQAPTGGEQTQPIELSLDWKRELAARLPLYGHRNWILVVDKAFPFQVASGITYLDSKAPLPEVLTQVLESIQDLPHIKPIVYQDAEISLIDDQLAPGSDDLKQQIRALLKDHLVRSLPHEAVFEKMDEAAALFGVLVIKTEAIIPYSSVFIELDCGYWDAGREQQLRIKEKRAQ